MSRPLTAVLVSAILMAASIWSEADANTPEASELVTLNSRIAKASGIRVITATGMFESRGAWVDSDGLHLAGAQRRFDASPEGDSEVVPWDLVSEVRIGRSHARQGAWVLGSLGALLGGAAGVFSAGFAYPPSTELTVGGAAIGLVVGGALGGAAGGLLGWGMHGWKTIWKDGHSLK